MSFRCDGCRTAQPPTIRPTFVYSDVRMKEYPQRTKTVLNKDKRGDSRTKVIDRGGTGWEMECAPLKLCPDCSGTTQTLPANRHHIKCDSCHRHGAYLVHDAFPHLRFDSPNCLEGHVIMKFGKENLKYKVE